MPRRTFLALPIAPKMAAAGPQAPLVLPVLHVMDSRAKFTPDRVRRFSSLIWPEAVRDFARCGIDLRSASRSGEVRRSPAGRPILAGLEHGRINLVLTGGIPLAWDKGRGVTGVSTRHEGYHVCMIALNYAHPHQIPFLSVNTCVHELLHVLFDDILEDRPKGVRGAAREFRIDLYATRLWLFHEGAEIRKAAQSYIGRAASLSKTA